MNNLVGVIVDAGHGGEDPGAISGGLREKDFTLQAALYMYDRLKELGIDARLTRSGDTSLPKSERIAKVKSLFNNSPNVILVSNHINAGGGEGAEIVYSLRNRPTLATMALENIKSAGQIGRGAYQRVLPENPSKDYYYILRESGNVEPILVEYGFIDNSRDASKLQNNILDYVEGVVKAIADYTGTKYTAPGVIPDTNTENTYIVQRGDTLYSIANKFNLTVNDLKQLNNLTSNNLYIGQVLQIRDIPLSNNYIVKKGDTLYALASKFNTSVNAIKELNNLTSNSLYIGQELLIPSAFPGDEIFDNDEMPDNEVIEDDEIIETPDDLTEYITYTVVKGDSLWAISRKFNIPVEELIRINNLNNNTINIGDVLLVPRIDNNLYTVAKGDTLWSIAKKYNVLVNDIKNLNNLQDNLLTVGQTIIIPN